MFVQLMLVFSGVLGLQAFASAGGWRGVLRQRTSLADRATNWGNDPAERLRRRRIDKRWMIAGRVLIFAAGTLALFETWPARQPLFIPDSPAKHAAWIEWLQSNTSPAATIACLPFPSSRNAKAYEPTTRWMSLQMFHNRQMVNGYSGFFPKSFVDVKKRSQNFPDRRSLEALERLGVDYCIIRRADLPATLSTADSMPSQLRLAFHDKTSGVYVFELRNTRKGKQKSPATNGVPSVDKD